MKNTSNLLTGIGLLSLIIAFLLRHHTVLNALFLLIVFVVLILLKRKSDESIKKQIAAENKLVDQTNKISERLTLSDKYSKMLSLVASQTFEAAIITDKDGKIEWVNDGFYQITGYTLPEVIGKKPGSVLQGPETNLDTIDRFRQKIISKKPFKDEILNYHKSGRKYWLSLSITPILDANGEIEKFIAIETDITEQKKAIQDLEEKLKSQG